MELRIEHAESQYRQPLPLQVLALWGGWLYFLWSGLRHAWNLCACTSHGIVQSSTPTDLSRTDDEQSLLHKATL